MGRGRMLVTALAVLAASTFSSGLRAQAPTPAPTAAATPAPATPTPDNALLLTIFLKHDQSRPLGEGNSRPANPQGKPIQGTADQSPRRRR